VFESLREPLVKLVRTVNESGKRPPTAKLTGNWPRAAQEEFARRAAIAVGFDFSATAAKLGGVSPATDVDGCAPIDDNCEK